jgi:hypothetical protein
MQITCQLAAIDILVANGTGDESTALELKTALEEKLREQSAN